MVPRQCLQLTNRSTRRPFRLKVSGRQIHSVCHRGQAFWTVLLIMCTGIDLQFLLLFEVVQGFSQLIRFAGCANPCESCVDPTTTFIQFMASIPDSWACTGQAYLRCIVSYMTRSYSCSSQILATMQAMRAHLHDHRHRCRSDTPCAISYALQ